MHPGDDDTTRHFGDFDRQLANIARLGVVSELSGGMARVQIGALETDLIPWTSRRAADDYDWWAPSVGEQVVVLTLWGDVSQGVIIGSVAQDKYAAPADGATWAKKFRDGTVLRYDPGTHQLDVTAANATLDVTCKQATIKAKSVTLAADTTHCSGKLKVDGAIEAGGNVNAKGDVSSQGDVKAGGISLKGHKHPGVQPGSGTTGGPV